MSAQEELSAAVERPVDEFDEALALAVIDGITEWLARYVAKRQLTPRQRRLLEAFVTMEVRDILDGDLLRLHRLLLAFQKLPRGRMLRSGDPPKKAQLAEANYAAAWQVIQREEREPGADRGTRQQWLKKAVETVAAEKGMPITEKMVRDLLDRRRDRVRRWQVSRNPPNK